MDVIILKPQKDYDHVWVTQRDGTSCFKRSPAQIMWTDYKGGDAETTVSIRVV